PRLLSKHGRTTTGGGAPGDTRGPVRAHAAGRGTVVPTAAYRRDLLLRMRMFIDQHLSDPELGPRLIAAAHNVSISYVHRLFGDDGTTVAGWIRARRL